MKPVINICEPAKHLWVAVPSYGQGVHPYHARALAYAAAMLNKAGVNLTIDTFLGNCYIDHARNVLATRFMASKASDMLLIDDDVEFEPDAVIAVASRRRPFVGGAYPVKADKLEWPITYVRKGEVDLSPDGLVEVAMLPTGFLRLNRAVLAAMDKGPYRFGPDDTIWRNYFQTGVRPETETVGRYWGEDTAFCDGWRGKGGKIYMVPNITFAHWGMRAHTGNWAKWAAADIAAQKAG